MARAFVFPGQGSQVVGMGRELADSFATARDVFAEVDEALRQHLSRLMFEGPEDQLTLTENAQPAIMAVSMAVAHVLQKDGGVDFAKTAKFVAGHSLGEYSALAASGAISLTDTARLLKTRGQAMQRAVPVGIGAMAVLFGLDIEQVHALDLDSIHEHQVCEIANDNAPGQVVISGHREAVAAAVQRAVAQGAKRSMLLPVSAPFHCALMAPAAEVMAQALADARVVRPVVPVVSNVTASATSDPATIRNLLVKQVTGDVCWRESVLYMQRHGVDTLVELGAGKVLTGLAKRISKEMAGVSLQSAADIDAFIKAV